MWFVMYRMYEYSTFYTLQKLNFQDMLPYLENKIDIIIFLLKLVAHNVS